MAKGNVPPTPQICEVCLKAQAVSDGHMIAVYCVHHQTGGAMALIDGQPKGLWQAYSPITAEQWADAILNGRGIVATLVMQKQAASAGAPDGSHSTEH